MYCPLTSNNVIWIDIVIIIVLFGQTTIVMVKSDAHKNSEEQNTAGSWFKQHEFNTMEFLTHNIALSQAKLKLLH